VPACASGVTGIDVALGWSIVVTTPRVTRKPWLVFPAAAGGGSAEAGIAPSATAIAVATSAIPWRLNLLLFSDPIPGLLWWPPFRWVPVRAPAPIGSLGRRFGTAPD